MLIQRLALAGVLMSAAVAGLTAERALAAGAGSGESPREVRAWLMRIHQAASHRNYQGTFVVSSSAGVTSSRIAHFCDGQSQFERIEPLDGPARQVFRHNDVVHTIWPSSKLVRVEQRDLLTSFPALLNAGDDRIHDVYELQTLPSERVAGREAHVLWVRPRDVHRYGYRLWADKASGLLLRSDVLGEQREVLESAAFSDVSIGVRPRFDSVLQPMRRLAGFRVVRPVLRSTTLSSHGWILNDLPAGFRQVSCVRRQIDSGELPREGEPDRDVLQAIYSDGLTHVSLFVESFDPVRHTQPLATSLGATRTLMLRRQTWWVTLVGDVPAATLQVFANGLERTSER